jgi:hypothetical protein
MIRVEGEEATATRTSMNKLANSYLNDGQFNQAAELHGRVLELRTRILGREGPLTIASMDLLGIDYWSLRQLDRAI